MTAVSSETMRQLDIMAAASGISTLELMENAGSAVAVKAKEIERVEGKNIAVFCGRGNNGGDGLVAARKLITDGLRADLYLLGKKEDVKNEAAINLKLLLKIKNVKELISEEDVERLNDSFNYSLVIDALTGTGFRGPIKGILKKVIDLINSARLPVLAVDVPSGLNADNGKAEPVAVTALYTLSFGLPKKGFYTGDGPSHTGSIEVVNIGFPQELLEKAIELEKGYERDKG
ncbi:MAG: NAD(P)H-hydrate epimerase [Candidatus Omnitrophica bacterium]|nr:NAD(P)H-hydrate epimerase [Candidatus Omnitrophota bacterium]